MLVLIVNTPVPPTLKLTLLGITPPNVLVVAAGRTYAVPVLTLITPVVVLIVIPVPILTPPKSTEVAIGREYAPGVMLIVPSGVTLIFAPILTPPSVPAAAAGSV